MSTKEKLIGENLLTAAGEGLLVR